MNFLKISVSMSNYSYKKFLENNIFNNIAIDMNIDKGFIKMFSLFCYGKLNIDIDCRYIGKY